MADGTLLFSFQDRDAAHRKLEEIRAAEGPGSLAECREEHPVRDERVNPVAPYQVWSGPMVRSVR
jgi:hypothetical protein